MFSVLLCVLLWLVVCVLLCLGYYKLLRYAGIRIYSGVPLNDSTALTSKVSGKLKQVNKKCIFTLFNICSTVALAVFLCIRVLPFRLIFDTDMRALNNVYKIDNTSFLDCLKGTTSFESESDYTTAFDRVTRVLTPRSLPNMLLYVFESDSSDKYQALTSMHETVTQNTGVIDVTGKFSLEYVGGKAVYTIGDWHFSKDALEDSFYYINRAKNTIKESEYRTVPSGTVTVRVYYAEDSVKAGVVQDFKITDLSYDTFGADW